MYSIMSQNIVIRKATKADKEARAVLLREAIVSHCGEAFSLFLLQELCLQVVVLMGAILFIFVGVPPMGLLLILPATAVSVYVIVLVAHYTIAQKHIDKQKVEECGFVAEAQESSIVTNPAVINHTIVHQRSHMHNTSVRSPTHNKIVGTVSLSERWGPEGGCWLHGLAVSKQYRSKGVGRELVSHACSEATSTGNIMVEAVTSELEYTARKLLHNAGWECRGAYNRKLVGAALTLLLTHHVCTLPHA